MTRLMLTLAGNLAGGVFLLSAAVMAFYVYAFLTMGG